MWSSDGNQPARQRRIRGHKRARAKAGRGMRYQSDGNARTQLSNARDYPGNCALTPAKPLSWKSAV